MNLFIETPRQARSRSMGAGAAATRDDVWLEDMKRQYASQAAGASGAACSGRVALGGVSSRETSGNGDPALQSTGSLFNTATSAGAPAREGCADYSVVQDSYRAELAFHRSRVHLRKLLAAVKVIALVLVVPVVLLSVFLVSYVLSCIMNGATADEVIELVRALPGRVVEFARSA